MTMEIQSFQSSAEDRLAILVEAERANEYLYQVLEVGQYMLQSGGEVSRVEDSIRRLCLAYEIGRAHV